MRRYTTLVFDAGAEAREAVAELNDGGAASNTSGAVRPVIWDARGGERLDLDLRMIGSAQTAL